MAGGGLEVFGAAGFDGLGGFLLLAAKVFEIGEAVAAADGLEVEIDELGMSRIESPEEVAAELLARWAGKTMAPPDFANAVNAGVTTSVNGRKVVQQIGLVTDLGLDGGHVGCRQSFVEIRLQVGLGYAWHEVLGFRL